jgi:hypothetical protein
MMKGRQVCIDSDRISILDGHDKCGVLQVYCHTIEAHGHILQDGSPVKRRMARLPRVT